MFALKFQPPFLFSGLKKKKKKILYKPFVCGETLVKKNKQKLQIENIHVYHL